MKGLLLKDWYMMKKYCKAYLLLVVAFLAGSFFIDDDLFYMYYPCLLCGMIPVNLLGYDEQSRWMQYSDVLPYTRDQIVSAKYLIGFMVQLVLIILTGIIQGVKMGINSNFVFHEYLILMLSLLVVSSVTTAASLPWIFKLGLQKGRMVYYLMVGIVTGASILASGMFRNLDTAVTNLNISLTVLAVIAIGVYVLSWYKSIVYYRKREL